MKKIGLFLICVLLVVAMAIPAFAANDTVFTVTANKSSVAKGDEVTFTVNVSGTTFFKSAAATPKFDTDKFELVGVQKGDLAYNANTLAGFAILNTGTDVPVGTVGTFTLKAKVGCGDTSAVTLSLVVKNGNEVLSASAKGASISFSGAHSYSEWATDGDANHARTCSVCGSKDTAPHAWVDGEITKAPTCAAEGEMTQTCECNATRTVSVPKNDDHDFDEGKVTTEPDCENKGVKTYTCKNGCGTTKTEEIAALGHTPAADSEITKAPTCEEDGVLTGKCSVCGKALENQAIPALGHDYELTAEVAPDCENAGSKTYVCKNDAAHTYTETIDALGHAYGAWTKVDDEKHQRTCATCGDVETVAHNWNSGTVTKEPTCVDAGEKKFACTDCNAERTEVMPATGVHEHNQYVDNLDDKTHTATCACGDVITEDHDYSVNGDVIVKPTTSKEGQQEMLCACGAKTIKTLPKIKDNNKGELDDVSKTGDITGQIVVFAVAVAASMTAAGYGLKRKFVK